MVTCYDILCVFTHSVLAAEMSALDKAKQTKQKVRIHELINQKQPRCVYPMISVRCQSKS